MSFVICATYYLGDKIKEMSYVGHVAWMGEIKINLKYWLENLKV
jgi:hypothetical protein